jgi:hypothetical protein
MNRKLTIFSSGDQAGAERAQVISNQAAKLGFQARVEDAEDVLVPLRAYLCDTAVVLDLSPVTNGNGQRLSAAYSALTTFLGGLQHVLVVSRGYLPLNVTPMRRGGAPAYPYPERSLPDGHPVGPVADTDGGEHRPWVAEGDASLLEWTRQQLADLADGTGLPSRRCSAGEWDRFTGMEASNPSTRDFLLGIQGEMLTESREWHRGQELRNQVFISHRGSYWAEVEELAGDVRAGRLPGMAARPVKAVRPGELALERELLSEGRRWMLFSLLDDMLRSCTELWVYETDDYLKSWWTLAELTAAAYIDNGEHPALALSLDPPAKSPSLSAFK